MIYDPHNWYWLASSGHVFSSLRSVVITTDDDIYIAWLDAGGVPTPWPSDGDGTQTDEALSDVLRPYGISVTVADRIAAATAAVEAHVQAVAVARKYTSAESCASYVTSTNAGWAAEAHAFVEWRDSIWSSVYATLAAVQIGAEPEPTMDALIAGLPVISWPA